MESLENKNRILQNNNTKRIARNTLYLYLRMLLTTLVSLYAARLVLKHLGVEDFGIYNVVGGIITFMGFLSATMSSATQRFLAFDLGVGDIIMFRKTYSMLLNVIFAFCLISFAVLELVGPFYINYYMNIPEDRIIAAQWAFQFSLLTFFINTVSIVFKSAIISYEKLDVYAYIGVAESFINLIAVLFLKLSLLDNLIFLSLIVAVSHLLITFVQYLYCSKCLSGCSYVYFWDKKHFNKLLSYSGWNLFGSITSVLNLQGQAIVLNLFYGPIVNAAKAIADRISGLVSQFASSFYMAVSPQIVKSYANGDINYMRALVINSSRYSYLLLSIIVIPMITIMSHVLELWLGKEQVSMEMVRFCQLILVYSLVLILEQPISMAVRATGDIKRYQICVGVVTLAFIPLCVFLFMFSVPAYFSIVLLILIYIIAQIVRIYFIKSVIQITFMEYFKTVIIPIIKTTIFATVLCVLTLMIPEINNLWFVQGIVTFFFIFITVLFVGINKKERKYLLHYVAERTIRKRKG